MCSVHPVEIIISQYTLESDKGNDSFRCSAGVTIENHCERVVFLYNGPFKHASTVFTWKSEPHGMHPVDDEMQFESACLATFGCCLPMKSDK